MRSNESMFGQDKDYSNEIYSTANRVRWQDVLDRPRPASELVLPRSIRGRSRGAGLCAGELPRHLEGLVPLDPDDASARCCSESSKIANAARGFFLKWRRGPSGRRPGRSPRHEQLRRGSPGLVPAIREVKNILAEAQDAARREDIFDLLEAIDAARTAAFRLVAVVMGGAS